MLDKHLFVVSYSFLYLLKNETDQQNCIYNYVTSDHISRGSRIETFILDFFFEYGV